jgi:hypothetical protein
MLPKVNVNMSVFHAKATTKHLIVGVYGFVSFEDVMSTKLEFLLYGTFAKSVASLSPCGIWEGYLETIL